MKSTGFNPQFTITNRITAGLTHIERARGFLEAATLSDAWVEEMGRRALILEAHHTTHIEGTRLTLTQAEQLLEGKPIPEADPDDVQELLNYKKAFEFVSSISRMAGRSPKGWSGKSTSGWWKGSEAEPPIPASTGKPRTMWSTLPPARRFSHRLRRMMCQS